MKIKNLTNIMIETIKHPLSRSVIVENKEGTTIVLREKGKYKGVDLSGVNLSGVKLNGIDLSGANLSNANLSGTDLRKAKLTGTNFEGAIITGTNFEETNIKKGQLSKAQFTIKPIGISLDTNRSGRK